MPYPICNLCKVPFKQNSLELTAWSRELKTEFLKMLACDFPLKLLLKVVILSRFWPKSVKYPFSASRAQKSHVLFGLSTKSPVLSGLNAKSHVLFVPKPGRLSKADRTPRTGASRPTVRDFCSKVVYSSSQMAPQQPRSS